MPLRNRLLQTSIGALIFLAVALYPAPEIAVASTVPTLGSAANFQIVSGAATSLGATLVGLDPTFITSSSSAVSDLRSAIASLAALSATSVPADLGGSTFLPGTYAAAGGAAFAMTSNIILDAKNNCDSTFIFITPAAMNTTAGVSITLANGAKASNVYWVVGGAITIAASSELSGNFLSSAAITVGASSSLDGRLLAMQAVTVGASVIFMGFPIALCTPSGGLSISVPESVSTRTLTAGETSTIEMDAVTVTDSRGISTGAFWDVSTISLGVRDNSGNELGAQYFSYSLRALTPSGGVALVSHQIHSMLTLNEIVSATGGLAVNGASWIPIIMIAVPINQTGGTYSGTIVHSVA